MCIIIYKKANQDYPSDDILRRCFEYNSDGAGYMYAYNNEVIIKKGFMTFEALRASIHALKASHGKKIPLVIHCRITTQAGVRADNCHPYPLCADMTSLRKLRAKADIGIAHNGIISLTTSYAQNITYNDTMKFITDYLTLIIKNRKYYKDSATPLLIERLIGSSRLAIMDGSGHVELLGRGWVEDGGIWYSNSTYKISKDYYYYNFKNINNSKYNTLIDYDKYKDADGVYTFPLGLCPVERDEIYDYCTACADKKYCYNISGTEEDCL